VLGGFNRPALPNPLTGETMVTRGLVLKIIFLGLFDAIAIYLALSLGSQLGTALGIAILILWRRPLAFQRTGD
jgi:hypothetical protein